MVNPVHPTDAVVHIVSRHNNTNHRRVLWRLTHADAKKVCSDPRTAGRNYLLVWTAHHVDDPDVNRYVPDRLNHAAVLTELDVTILASYEKPAASTPAR